MKARFEKLMRQAIAECKPDDNPSKDRTLQRFAELIVKDCIDVAERNLELEPWAIVSVEIQEHFDATLDQSFMVGDPNGNL
jgi:hypothetical protein